MGHAFDDGVQFFGKFMRDRFVLYAFTEGHCLFHGFHARQTGHAIMRMFFDFSTGRPVQFPIDIFGEFGKHFQATLMVMLIVAHFQNNLSVLPLKPTVHGEA